MLEYWSKKEAKVYKEQGEQATKKELKQLHDLDTFEPVDANSLTDHKTPFHC